LRKVAVVVTARPSYSRIKTALRAIDEHPELELQLVVAASALLERYGTAVKYMEADGFKIAARVFNVLEGENLTAQAKTTGLGIMELSNVFANLEPDVVVTVADRFETMSTAIAASYMNIPLVHIQGGEVTGNMKKYVMPSLSYLIAIWWQARTPAAA
jgi:UDP-N-acetylglucosamine 2-epimerase